MEIKIEYGEDKGDKSGNYKYDEGYKKNEYHSELQREDQREMARPGSWRRAP